MHFKKETQEKRIKGTYWEEKCLFLKRNTRKKDKGHLLRGEVPNHKRELKEKVGGCLPLGAPCCITVLACSQHTPILGRDIASSVNPCGVHVHTCTYVKVKVNHVPDMNVWCTMLAAPC